MYINMCKNYIYFLKRYIAIVIYEKRNHVRVYEITISHIFSFTRNNFFFVATSMMIRDDIFLRASLHIVLSQISSHAATTLHSCSRASFSSYYL